MGFEIRKNPDFSWSSSRSRLFEECELCYGLYYYTAHNGWLDSSTPLSQAAYRYKATRSVEQRLYQSITSAIYDHFYKDSFSKEAFKSEVRGDLNRAFKASKDFKKKWYESPKHVPMLTEMIEGGELPKELIQDISDKMSLSIDSFFDSKTVKEAKSCKILNLSRFNKFKLKDFQKPGSLIDGLTVFVGIHLLYTRKDGKIVAVNFHTNDNESHIDQLGSIALYLLNEYDVSLSDIIIRDELLESGTFVEHTVTKEDINEMFEVIADSVGMMAEYVVDGDIKKNEGLPIKEFIRNPDHDDDTAHVNCPYCQLVKNDLKKYPNGVKSYQV